MTQNLLDAEGLKRLAKQLDTPPDFDALVAAGTLALVSRGWYEAKTKEAFDAVAPFVTAVRSDKNGRAQFKVTKRGKRLSAPPAA